MDDSGNHRRGRRLVLGGHLGGSAGPEETAAKQREGPLRHEAPAGVVQKTPERTGNTAKGRAGEDHTNTQVTARAPVGTELAELQQLGHAHGGRRPLAGPRQGGREGGGEEGGRVERMGEPNVGVDAHFDPRSRGTRTSGIHQEAVYSYQPAQCLLRRDRSPKDCRHKLAAGITGSSAVATTTTSITGPG